MSLVLDASPMTARPDRTADDRLHALLSLVRELEVLTAACEHVNRGYTTYCTVQITNTLTMLRERLDDEATRLTVEGFQSYIATHPPHAGQWVQEVAPVDKQPSQSDSPAPVVAHVTYRMRNLSNKANAHQYITRDELVTGFYHFNTLKGIAIAMNISLSQVRLAMEHHGVTYEDLLALRLQMLREARRA